MKENILGAPQWAPRVKQRLIRQLYDNDARGMPDEELIDEVGWALHARCDSFIGAVEAARGRARCLGCGGIIVHDCQPETTLRCAECGWETTWRAYFRTFQHRQLSGAEPVLDLFRSYMERFSKARGPREKMLLIDGLIHGFHQYQGEPTRTTGVNLIEGNYHEVVDFLDRLAYGDASTPGMRETHENWRRAIDAAARAWGDQRLRRLP